MTQISQHFTAEEFKCNCGGKYCKGDTVPGGIDRALLYVLEVIRWRFGKPMTINSAIRCPAWNRKWHGVSNSQHLYGKAADIKVRGVAPAQVAACAKQVLGDGHGGVGTYPTFTHVDIRSTAARWTGGGE